MIPILSKSQETKYRQKCKDLKRRIQEIEDFNEATALNLARTKRAIIRVRLERELLLEKLEELGKAGQGEGLGSESTDDEVEVGLSDLQRALLLRASDPPSARAASNNKASQAGTAAALAAIASVQGKGSNGDEDEAGDGSESPKKRTVRNPDMPKRPQNAYIIFCEREKEGVRASMELEAEGETFDLTRALADSWKELGQTGRQPYYKLYQDDRKRYLEEMSEYVAENPSEAEQKEIQRAIKALEELKSGKGEEGDEDKEEEKVEKVVQEKIDEPVQKDVEMTGVEDKEEQKEEQKVKQEPTEPTEPTETQQEGEKDEKKDEGKKD